MKNLKRQCLVCGDKIQTNVIFKWKRNRDNVIFHVCALCAENGDVNADSVIKSQNKTYTTYEEQDFSGPVLKRRVLPTKYDKR